MPGSRKAARAEAADADAYDQLFGALAHGARRQIAVTLHFAGGAMSAGEIAAFFDHAWPTTTRHLKVLQEAGVVSCEREGRSQIYRLQRDRLRLAADWLDHLTKEPV